MHENKFRELLKGWIAQQLTEQEIEEFLAALKQPEFRDIVGDQLQDDLVHGKYVDADSAEDRQRVFDHLMLNVVEPRKPKVRYLRWMSAAASVLVVVTLGYFLLTDKKKPVNGVASATAAPAETVATFTLPDGTKIRVDTLSNSLVLKKYNVRLTRNDAGEIVMTSLDDKNGDAQLMAKVDNPRGSSPLKLKLSDGTLVWLNTQSSINYPMVFDGDKRQVSLTGEAYFEVAKNASKRFLVKTKELTTEVLGTNFNVNAYPDEVMSKVTLLEGSVKVIRESTGHHLKLQPNQQAVMRDSLRMNEDVNVDDVMAWKNGMLSFNNSDIRTIMREIGRWYDLDVEFRGQVPNVTFSGRISRSTTLEEVLKILNRSDINFKVENDTIVVMP